MIDSQLRADLILKSHHLGPEYMVLIWRTERFQVLVRKNRKVLDSVRLSRCFGGLLAAHRVGQKKYSPLGEYNTFRRVQTQVRNFVDFHLFD